MISEHLAMAEIVGTGYRVPLSSGEVTLDESQSPYVRGQVRIPLPEDLSVLDALDPRKGGRVRLNLTQRFGLSEPLSALSEDFRRTNLMPTDTMRGQLFNAAWSTSGAGTLTQETTGGPDEGSWMKATATTPSTASPWSLAANATAEYAPVTAGKTYTASVYIKASKTLGNVRILGEFKSATGSNVVGFPTGYQGAAPTEWTRYEYSVVAPAGATHLRIGAVWSLAASSQTAGDWYGLAMPMVNEGSTAAEFSSATGTLADISAAFENLTGITNTYGIPYNEFGTRASTSRRFNLGVRTRDIDYGAGTVTIDLESDEALLIDYALLSPTRVAPAQATVRSAVQMVLGYIGETLTPGTDDAPIEADAVFWQPGQTAYDYYSALVKAAGLRLYCDEQRRWHLTQPLAPTEGSLSLSTGPNGNAHVLQEKLSREEYWFDAVVITYRWRDNADVEHVRYDIAEMPNASRVYTEEYERPWPGNGAAQAILDRARGRGRIESVTTDSNYSASPGQALSISSAGMPTQSGLVTSVSWSVDSGTMNVRSRDLIDTPANAWVLIPSAATWETIPVGMDWTELSFEMEGTS